MPMATILLSTLNARHYHSALGLRCVAAQLRPLGEQAEILEFTLQQSPADVSRPSSHASATRKKKPTVRPVEDETWARRRRG